jgi:hypothetical protein
MTIFVVYLLATGIVAAWLGQVMWRHLDGFDWQYRSDDVWTGFWLGVLLWPLWLIVRPSLILRGTTVLADDNLENFDINGVLANRRRQVHQAIKNPPSCGARVSYGFPDFEHDSPVQTVFEAADIEAHFKGRELPLFWGDEQEALVVFIKGRDDSSPETTPIPEAVDFEDMAAELIDAGIGEVYCAECGAYCDAHSLEKVVPPLTPGWNFADYVCPAGHKTFRRKHIHILPAGRGVSVR